MLIKEKRENPSLRWRVLVAVLSSLGLPIMVDAQQTKVDITPHRQEHSLSCEVATLKMALSAHDINITEEKLISELDFDRTERRGGIWGDPNKGFVGRINGQMMRDGYGVYWDPIAKLGSKYTQTKILKHGSPQQLATEIKAGNPVIIWGYYGPRRPVNWKTPSGTTIQAANGEHTRIVYGFDGSVTSPTRFYLIDPLSGQMSWSTSELMHNWSIFNHMGVVVTSSPKWARAINDTKIWELDVNKNTRRWISNWDAFVKRGGSAHQVASVTVNKLLQYTPLSPIN